MISMAGKAIRRWWALFVLPTFVAFFIGFLVPFIYGIYLSFCSFTTVTDAKFIGWQNYARAIKDKEFLHALGFSTLMTIVTTIVINVVAFAIAYLLTKSIRGSNLFRSVFSCRTSSAASFWAISGCADQRRARPLGALAHVFGEIRVLGPGDPRVLAADSAT